MKTLIIGTLIATLMMSPTVLAALSVGAAGELDQQSSEFSELGNPEQSPYVPFSNNSAFAGRYPYEGNFPNISNAYAYPMQQSITIPAAGANMIHSGRDIDHSGYTQVLEPES